ncbi:hypothetical protein CAL25_17960 [Bordetella genomosp. 5]|uniref:Endonuclease/exonuclease/phosphatase domain-containing protein n=2 Tax=Bordetella genomosp. 5 TaxID=1395608 RepID=A0A261TAC9_9BORD|nr:hypothetical protein CAL25_17960 [Bordetella genomosp. 5]
MDVDIICLGEVSEADVTRLLKLPCLKDYEVFNGTEKAGRSRFDVCVFFKRGAMRKSASKQLLMFSGESVLKVGQRIDLDLVDDETRLHIFISHWPSRLMCDEHHVDRHTLGIYLRSAVTDALGEDHSGHAIVLGDFNDEPFSPSLHNHLMASRDRNLVATRKPHLLYNPFWKHVAPSTAEPGPESDALWRGGSHHYGAGQLSRWHMYDQIIFSSAFLGRSSWMLQDETAGVVDFPPFTGLVLNKKSKFDHMPVVATIARKKNG